MHELAHARNGKPLHSIISASGQGLKSVNNFTVIRAIQFLTADENG